MASDLPVLDGLRIYRLSWAIEWAFSALKALGLNLESTHMTAPERISRLFGLIRIALAWMATDKNSCPSTGQARASGHERDADRVADPESSGAVGRRGPLGLSAAPQNAVPNRSRISSPKCHVTSRPPKKQEQGEGRATGRLSGIGPVGRVLHKQG